MHTLMIGPMDLAFWVVITLGWRAWQHQPVPLPRYLKPILLIALTISTLDSIHIQNPDPTWMSADGIKSIWERCFPLPTTSLNPYHGKLIHHISSSNIITMILLTGWSMTLAGLGTCGTRLSAWKKWGQGKCPDQPLLLGTAMGLGIILTIGPLTHLMGTHLMGTHLVGTHLVGTHLMGTHPMGTHLMAPHFHRADVLWGIGTCTQNAITVSGITWMLAFTTRWLIEHLPPSIQTTTQTIARTLRHVPMALGVMLLTTLPSPLWPTPHPWWLSQWQGMWWALIGGCAALPTSLARPMRPLQTESDRLQRHPIKHLPPSAWWTHATQALPIIPTWILLTTTLDWLGLNPHTLTSWGTLLHPMKQELSQSIWWPSLLTGCALSLWVWTLRRMASLSNP